VGLFELLIILVFIVIPIVDGIQKQRQKSRGPGNGGEGRPEPGRPDPPGEEPQSAADMVPADLWELLTGEKRPGQGSESGEGEASWPAGEAEAEGIADWRPSDRWPVEEETVSAEYDEPVSAEYESPAYSPEAPVPETSYMERLVPSPEQRHREFHALIDAPREARGRRASPLIRALRSREGLKQAVLFKEILGTPKGLE
jgi:hypothetical protein